MIPLNLITKFVDVRYGRVRSNGIWPAAILLAVCGSGCGSANQNSAQRYNLTGRVVSTDAVNKSVVVDGDEIPGYMAPMAMPYRIKNVSALQSIRAGDQIKAEIVVTDRDAYLENISVIKPADGSKPPRGGSQDRP
jgi:Cu/Ag efflux protein CusF